MTNQSSGKAETADTPPFRKYLTFLLAGESYGIEVVRIREITRPAQITALPQMPDFIKGTIHLRGKAIPLVDLRRKFALPPAHATERTCVLTVQVVSPSGTRLLVGLLVDAVEEIVHLGPADIAPPSGSQADAASTYLLGVATVEGRSKALLDIDRVLGGDTAETLIRITTAL